MKKVLIFIGLKIAEISAIVFIPYFIGVFDKNTVQWLHRPEWQGGSFFYTWFNGLGYILYLAAGSCGIALIGLVIVGNWKWAKKISNDKT